MTALGGIGHTLPFLIQEFRVVMAAAVLVVVIEWVSSLGSGIFIWRRLPSLQRCKSDWADSLFSLPMS
jgi:hypothetical protein